jgi:hypothetical protein
MAAKSFGDLRVGTECRRCTGLIIGLARLRNPLLADIHQKTKGPKKKQTKNFFGDALGCIHARELIRSAIERASDRALAQSEKRWGPGVAVMGAAGRVWTKSRGTKQAIFLGMWALTGVACAGAGIRVFIGLVYEGKPDIVFRFIIEYSSLRGFGP